MNQLLKFVQLTQEFKGVRRKLLIAKENREENDAEHSFQLAIVAWFLISRDNIPLNLELAFKYALAHDLVEVYAGDTPAALHKNSAGAIATKNAREEAAAKQIKLEFPEFGELHDLIRGYEERKDPESNFIYALDKILPLMNVYLDGGHSWKFHDISLEDVISNKRDKFSGSPEIGKYFRELVTLLEKDPSLFPVFN